MTEVSWTEAQWQKVKEAVTEAFGQASVASALDLPCYGPLPGGTETVRNERLIQQGTTVRLEVDHNSLNLRFVNLQVDVDLSSEQVADETMMNALLVFRRAANILAQEEDRIVFDGYQRGGNDSTPSFVSNNPRPQKGLADPLERLRFPFIDGASIDGTGRVVTGESVVPAVVTAIQRLERDSNPGPFTCILGNRLYEAVHTPNVSLVLPADRIVPILKGPLLRSGQMNEYTGIVISRSAGAVDIVVGTPPTVQFLQRTPAGRFLFRIYERFVLRVRVRDQTEQPVAGFIVPDIASALHSVAGAASAIVTAERALEGAQQQALDAANRLVRATSET